MADASYQQTSFLGGEIGQFAQGRYDRADYRTCLTVCLNMHPLETGALTRRPGSGFAGTTRHGAPGRNISFDFEQSAAYMMEFTDGFLRFRTGTRWATTNDSQVVSAISAVNPAIVQTAGTNGWSSGNTIVFGNYGSNTPLLQNRQFVMTVVDPTHFSLTDAITGATIDGSTLGALLTGTTVSRIQELVTPYSGGSWSSIRNVQAETSSFLLQGDELPQIVTATTLPNLSTGIDAQFSLATAVFNDGPYLDPFINGAQVTPSAKSGIISLTLSFPAYSATTAYPVGSFVTSAAINYVSLIDQNVNNTPAGSPSAWAVTDTTAAIYGVGFQGTDVGRLVRLYSEPDIWLVGTAYTAGQIVSYNPSGLPGGNTYWTCLVNNTGKIPGNDLTNWTLATNAALWSWGKITSLSNNIPSSPAGIAYIGNMTLNGGLSSAFDGNTNKTSANTANKNGPLAAYVGVNYTGATPSSHQIKSATVYPPSNVALTFAISGGSFKSVTATLYAKNSLPANATDGTALGSVTLLTNPTAPFSITSSDVATAWTFVWVTLQIAVNGSPSVVGYDVAQVVLFNPSGTGVTNGINVEILGPPLLYTTPIRTWRLGVYSNTTGWPTCGCYHEGRLWLGGVVANRFDASVSNGITGNAVNFAPTDQYGTVTAASGITEVLNSDGVNPIIGMVPDLQGIIMGTFAGEWLVFGPQGAIAPNNIAARRMTRIGWANVEPRRTDNCTIAVQRYGRRLVEYFAEVHSGKFSGPNLARWAMHLTSPGIAELAYQQAVIPVIWFRTTDGQLRGITYKRDALQTSNEPGYNGFHQHTLGSGRTVTSIAVGPSVDGTLDTLYMVTTDGVVCHVEVITDLVEEGETLFDAWYCDDAVTPTSTTTSNVTPAPYGGLTLNGLWHLNGQLVTAWLAGLDCGDHTVVNGSIAIPYGDGVAAGTANGLFTAAAYIANPTAVVGFTFTSQAQIVRPNHPSESGARNGPALGKKRRTAQYAIQLEGTQGLSVGTSFAKTDPCRFRQDDDTPYLLNQQFTGTHWDMLTDPYSYDSMICWQITRPYPANVTAVSALALQTQDK